MPRTLQESTDSNFIKKLIFPFLVILLVEDSDSETQHEAEETREER
jgi:hypothetical protein